MEEITITVEEIRLLSPVNTVRMIIQNKKTWDKAFAIYNKNNNTRLSTNCMPCYPKVYLYLIDNLDKWKK